MKRLLREPLVHFLALGAALFALYATLHRPEDRRVVLTAGDVAQIREAFAAQWLRGPTAEEMAGLVEDRLREEVLSREALRLGLDRNDVIVRRRLAQKIQFLYEDLAATDDPADRTLERYLAARAERFRLPGLVSFTHVYFSTDRRGEAGARAEAEAVLRELHSSASAPPRLPERGDPFMLQYDYPQRSAADVGQLFGFDFARALFALHGDGWQGPLRSGYGWHLVRIFDRSPGRLPALAEIRDAVATEWKRERRVEANRAAYQRLRERYDVVLDTAQATP